MNQRFRSNRNNGVYSNYGPNDNPSEQIPSPNDDQTDFEVENINSVSNANLPDPVNAPTDRLQLEYTNFVPQNLRLNSSSTMGNIGEYYKHGNIEEFAEENPSEFGIKKPKSTNATETVGNGEDIVGYENPMQLYNNVRKADINVDNAANSAEDSSHSEVSGGTNVAKGGANGSDERQDYYMMSVKILDRARWNQKIREYIEQTRIPPQADESTNINESLTPPGDLYEELLTDIINDGRIVSVRYVDLPDNAARFSVKNVPGVRVWGERPATEEADTSQGTEETAMQPSGSEETFGVAETSEKVEEPLEEIQQPAAAAAPEPEEIPEKFREAREIFFSMPERFIMLIGCQYDKNIIDPKELFSYKAHYKETKSYSEDELVKKRRKHFNFYVRFTQKRNGTDAPTITPIDFPKTLQALEWLILDLCNIMSGNVLWEEPKKDVPLSSLKGKNPELQNIQGIKDNECKQMPSLLVRIKRISEIRHKLFDEKSREREGEIITMLETFQNKSYTKGDVFFCLRTLFIDFFKILLLFLGGEWRDLISGAYEEVKGTDSKTNAPYDKKVHGAMTNYDADETIGQKLRSIKTELLTNKTLEKFAEILGIEFSEVGDYIGETMDAALMKSSTTLKMSSADQTKLKTHLNNLFDYMNVILRQVIVPFSFWLPGEQL